MVENVEYEIPIHFMKRLIQVYNSDEFNFIIKSSTNNLNELNYRTTVNKAHVISNKINEIYRIDPTITEYEFVVPNFLFKSSNEEDDQLHSVASTIDLIIKSATEKVIVTKEKKKQINIILGLLGDKIEDEESIKINNINESISYLHTQFHDESLKYMSSHLIDMINEDQLFKLDDQIINDIIDSYFNETRNKSSNEEEELIFEKLKNSEEIRFVMHFLLQIECDKYTKEMSEYISSHLTDDIVSNEMNVIVKKFSHLISQNQKEKNESSIQIEYEDNELKGIISYLKNEYGENICEKGEIKIYDNGNHSYIHGNILNVINYKNINDFYSNNWGEDPVPNSYEGWIEFDFLKRKINLKSYTLRSNLYYHAKSWRILGSNDRNHWDVIDQKTNDFLNGKYKQHRFECENNKQNYYQYIRFIQDDSFRGDRKHNVDLTAIEFFGSILT